MVLPRIQASGPNRRASCWKFPHGSSPPERNSWNGLQARLPDAFWMSKQKGEHTIAAVCEVWTHPSGWELRLIIGGAHARPQILAIDEIGYSVRRRARGRPAVFKSSVAATNNARASLPPICSSSSGTRCFRTRPVPSPSSTSRV